MQLPDFGRDSGIGVESVGEKKPSVEKGKRKRTEKNVKPFRFFLLSLPLSSSLSLSFSPRLKLPVFLSPMLNEPRFPSPWLPLPVLPLLFSFRFFSPSFFYFVPFDVKHERSTRTGREQGGDSLLPSLLPSLSRLPPPPYLSRTHSQKTHPRLLSPLLPHPTLFAPWLAAHFSSPGLALAAGAAQGELCLEASANEKAPDPNSPWALRQAVAGSTQLRHSELEEDEDGAEGSSEAPAA